VSREILVKNIATSRVTYSITCYVFVPLDFKPQSMQKDKTFLLPKYRYKIVKKLQSYIMMVDLY